MTVRKNLKAAAIGLALVVPALWVPVAHAGGVTLQLVRTSALTNVDDAAGRWQHEGGNINKVSGLVTTSVGQYAIHRRVTNGGASGGTTAQNTAMTTITLFFTNTGLPPQNVTLEGAHHFTNGRFAGSVSAASNRYSWIQGADATYAPTTTTGTSNLSIIWAGSNQLTLP
jgi:hypothetical protein